MLHIEKNTDAADSPHWHKLPYTIRKTAFEHHKFIIRCFEWHNKVQDVLAQACLNCQLKRLSVEMDRTVSFLSKQFCFLVVARLNSRRESENTASTLIFDEPVAEYCMALSTKGTSVDHIIIFVKASLFLFF